MQFKGMIFGILYAKHYEDGNKLLKVKEGKLADIFETHHRRALDAAHAVNNS